MATGGTILARIFRYSSRNNCRFISTPVRSVPTKPSQSNFLLVVGGSIVLYSAYKRILIGNVHASQIKTDDEKKPVKLTTREKRFIRFSSVEFDGQLYMTPQDFLESVVEAEPRARLKRKVLTQKDLERIRDSTPPLSQGSPRLFRGLRDKGIISYTEYLFLLSILTKPQSGFRIAFNMFDTDGNERVDKNEFLVIRKLLAGKKVDRFNVDDMDVSRSSLEV